MEYLSESFGIEANLASVLYLIGVHESGCGFGITSRERKTELIKMAQCTLLSQEKFFLKLPGSEKQQSGWIENPTRPLPSDLILERLLQSLILDYFNKKIFYSTVP